MIREISRKEYVERKPLLGIAFAMVLALTAALPNIFSYSLAHAMRAIGNDTAESVLLNFRSYQVFVESDWLARNLSRILCLLALLSASGAIAGEREARTLPLLYTSSVRLRSVVFVKFGFFAAWLFLVTFASFAVLTALSLVEKYSLGVAEVGLASFVAWTNALAFLGVVFAASAFSRRTVVAGGAALVCGFAIAGALAAFGLNGTALATNLFAADGGVLWSNAVVDVLAAAAVATLGLVAALFEVDRRRAT